MPAERARGRWLAVSLTTLWQTLLARRRAAQQPDGPAGSRQRGRSRPEAQDDEAGAGTADTEVPLDADVLIIGSGYGGAIAAEHLTRQSVHGRRLRVLMLERGREYASGDFPSSQAQIGGHLRFATPEADSARGRSDGLFDLRVGPDLGVLVANGLGGGSLINAGVLEPPRAEVFASDAWPKAIRDAAPTLVARAEQLRGRLGARPWPHGSAKGAALEKLAPADWRPVHLSVAPAAGPNAAGVHLSACLQCGDCFSGCNHRAKDSLDLNLLQQAAMSGGDDFTVATGATVRRLRAVYDDDKTSVLRWIVDVEHTELALRRRESGPFKIRARMVVLAAGALGSTEILLRSRGAELPLSGQLGRRFSANGDLIAALHDLDTEVRAVADEHERPDRRGVGPTITSMLDLRQQGGPVIQDMAVPAALRTLYAEAFALAHGLDALARCDRSTHAPGMPDRLAMGDAELRRSLVVAVMGHDGADGELRLPSRASSATATAVDTGSARRAAALRDGVLSIHWPGLKRAATAEAAQQRLETLHAASGLGGRTLANPLWRPLAPTLEKVFGPQRGPMITVHPLGGCAMADGPERGVVDDTGAVFRPDGNRHPGLYVLDGAIVPCALGVNPALAIATLAEHAVAQWPLETLLPAAQAALEDTAAQAAREETAALAALEDTAALPLAPVAPAWPPRVERPGRQRPRARRRSATLVEITERLRGQWQCTRDGRSKRLDVELTLLFRPVRVRALCDGRASERVMRVKQGKLTLRDAALGPGAKPVAVLAVKGQARLFGHEASTPGQRVWRAGRAWLLNRGIRDITQVVVDRLTGPATARAARDAEEAQAAQAAQASQASQRAAPPLRARLQGVADKARGLVAMLSHAGTVRTLDYALTVHDPDGAAKGRGAEPPIEGRLVGRKRFTYARAANPWQQLSSLELLELPAGCVAQGPLCFDADHAAEIGVPLMRVLQQQDRPGALFDLAALALYVARQTLTVHAFTFRKPDAPVRREPRRLADTITWHGGPLEPELAWVEVWPASPQRAALHIRLARYRPPRLGRKRGALPPVLLLHGYSASSTTFAHDAIPGHLVGALLDAGRDVWVADLRTSAGLASATHPWRFEDVSRWDIPAAVQHVLRVTGQPQLDVVAHCMGAAMLSMALLFKDGTPGESDLDAVRSGLSGLVRRIVLSQVGPYVKFSPDNTLRAYLMGWVRHFLPLERYSFRDEPGTPVTSELLDRLLGSLPYPEHEIRQENPWWPPGARLPWVGTRHRMDALYGRTFSLANMPQAVLEHIDDFFGPLSVETVSQVIHFARQFSITQVDGFNSYTAPERLAEKMAHPVLSLHGADNGLADPKTLGLMVEGWERAGLAWRAHEHPPKDQHQPPVRGHFDTPEALRDRIRPGVAPGLYTWLVQGHGHQDCLMGADAGTLNAAIADFLGAREAA